MHAFEKDAGRFVQMELRHLKFSDIPVVVVVWAGGCGRVLLRMWVLAGVQAVVCDNYTDLLQEKCIVKTAMLNPAECELQVH